MIGRDVAPGNGAAAGGMVREGGGHDARRRDVGREPVVVARAATKRYGSFTAVDAVDFEVRRGEVLGLLGPNGAGKSTTMRMTYQVTPLTSGSLEVFGLQSGKDARSIKARLGVVPQIDNLDEELNVRENLLIHARYHGVPRDEARERASTLLDFAGLEDKATSPVRALSGGMKRRLTMARGLVSDPELVLLDEPTTGLDPQVRIALWERIDALARNGVTVVMSTHYMDEAERLCDRLLIMDQGKIVAEGSPRALIQRHLPASVIEGTLRGGHAAPFERLADRTGTTSLRSGDRISVFVADGRLALDAVTDDGADPATTFVRPTNLEDLFLHLTGRGLRE